MGGGYRGAARRTWGRLVSAHARAPFPDLSPRTGRLRCIAPGPRYTRRHPSRASIAGPAEHHAGAGVLRGGGRGTVRAREATALAVAELRPFSAGAQCAPRGSLSE